MLVTHQTAPKRWDCSLSTDRHWLHHHPLLPEWPRAACAPLQHQAVSGRARGISALCLWAPCWTANREKHVQRGSVVQFLSTDQQLKASIIEIESHCHGKSRLEMYCWWGESWALGGLCRQGPGHRPLVSSLFPGTAQPCVLCWLWRGWSMCTPKGDPNWVVRWPSGVSG